MARNRSRSPFRGKRVNQHIKQAFPDDPDEQLLLDRAVGRAVANPSKWQYLDYSPSSTVVRNLGLRSIGETFRKAEKIARREIRLATRQIAFGALPDPIREEYASFCHLMYKGFQKRFLNRHPEEEPEEFLERPRKTTLNLTKLIVKVKSLLYKNPPVREIDEEWSAINPKISNRLSTLWSDLWNLTMIHVDRMTLLLGTVSVRPMIDQSSKGGIRLWVFLPNQLRVIPNPTQPWRPQAVIERHDPENRHGKIIIWTDKSQLDIEGGAIVQVKPHGMGRIPHTFFKNELDFQSYFVEGAGRGLCDENANINDKLSDLNEIVQMQGFGNAQVFNPTEDKITVSPRSAMVFETDRESAELGIKQGIEYAKPDAPIPDVRADVESDIMNLLKIHRVPEAAVGVDLGRRALSGIALRAAFSPLLDDLEEREKLFRPYEADLADNALRVLNEYEEGFSYSPAINGRPEFSVKFQEPALPVSTDDQLKSDEFDIAQGITTPAAIIRRKDPARFDTHEEAVEQWRKNLDEVRAEVGGAGGFSDMVDDGEAMGEEGSLVSGLIRKYGDGDGIDGLADAFDGLDEAVRRRNGAG